MIYRVRPLKVKYHGISRTGHVKPDNQDRFGVFESGDAFVLAVCDGMGGHAGGDVAAAMALEAIGSYVMPAARVESSLHELAVAASEAIETRGNREADLQYMGTTMTAALLSEAGCWFVHVGDSRLYRLHRGELRQLTTDHRFVQELIDAGEMTELEVRHNPLRHQLDQALGVPGVEPQTGAFQAEPGDIFLVCSDGITDELFPDMIQDILESAEGVEDMAEALVQAALDCGGKDNSTAVVVVVEQ